MRLKPALVALIVASGSLALAPLTIAETKAAVRAEKQPLKLSKSALATAVKDAKGKAVGAKAYADPADALKAGDMAAYLQILADLPADEREDNPMYTAYLALDRAAAGDTEGARAMLKDADKDRGDGESSFFIFIDAWLLAIEGKSKEAVERQRTVSADMPGLTGDLALAAMLESLGRNDEALAVYTAMTPAQIKAPEHDFDPQIIVYAHVQQVIYRHSMLLQRLGKIDQAKAVYQRLAKAEPERAAFYAAAMETLETGKGLDNKALTVRSAFSRSLSDVSNALQEQRILRTLMLGGKPENFDEQRVAFDLAALLIHPDDEDVRSSVIAALYRDAHYDGVAHVARSAPKATAGLQLSAAQALIKVKKNDEARASLSAALKLVDEDNKLGTEYGALQLYTTLEDEKNATKIVKTIIDTATNTAEKAAAYGVAADTYAQFGSVDKAADYAIEARKLDDTHERRMALVDVLGKAGRIEPALDILRSELILRPNDPYTYNTFGYFLITRTDRLDEGFKLLFRARGMAERDPYIADSLGWAYYKLGDLASAQRLIEESRREVLPHHNWEIESHLGDIYWHQGEKDKARAAWTLALENNPPLVEKHQLEKQLKGEGIGPKPAVRPIPDVTINEEDVNEQEI